MKKILIILLGLSLSQFMGADIGENFEPAGFELTAGGSFNKFLGLISEMPTKTNRIDFQFNFMVNRFVIRNVSLGAGLSLDYNSHVPFLILDNEDSYVIDIKQISISLDFGITKYFINQPEANRGFAAAIGILGKIETEQLFDISDLGYYITPRAMGYYFITDRAAFFCELSGTINIVANYSSMLSEMGMTFGISYFIPSRKRSLF